VVNYDGTDDRLEHQEGRACDHGVGDREGQHAIAIQPLAHKICRAAKVFARFPSSIQGSLAEPGYHLAAISIVPVEVCTN
jgi:hypothetical protein